MPLRSHATRINARALSPHRTRIQNHLMVCVPPFSLAASLSSMRPVLLDCPLRRVIHSVYTAVMGNVRLSPAMQRAARMLRAPPWASPTDLPEPHGERALPAYR